jgi:hypothetical protein
VLWSQQQQQQQVEGEAQALTQAQGLETDQLLVRAFGPGTRCTDRRTTPERGGLV